MVMWGQGNTWVSLTEPVTVAEVRPSRTGTGETWRDDNDNSG